ncbi:dTDP-4-dehydrorhamnose reductase [Francisella philomiragia]|uniref:dTDP-4-dehydrorhamnose reductase n=1 Tax=Francisella philomiragia TaxID=28110 RepID=UPI001904ABE8|nr:dTDP-4-dehydrorhamnose reductase [Francisella philomiragia]MBK2267737.1 dTDP-4-dehydrorhamnose reductase [Francisella philomiragia]MBK2279164.1 dTDP-4-dehydrorhamnose reductase [Francisella philomiragia]MBK2287047.1 dTDP-4-dehydrorhamnose reductase [Francisella philomiragia]MBK2288996.1 dTDP-4-dehydrorhamnose reductase [Francisella philomiragia]MBK2290714.1 dTDP-4-dehydrorhamnose reductase [Francisella philomiragia]
MKILVTGSNGQLGSELKELVSNSKLEIQNYTFIFADSKSLDITGHEAVKQFVIDNDIRFIINCAAYTAVDKAETDIERADKINHLAVANIAKIAKEYDIKLVHISTDYVFDGHSYRPYLEDDQTNPQGVYGSTKLAGEQAILDINPKNSIIIRTSWVYSYYGNNFVKTMLRLGRERDSLGVIYDQVGTPTYAKDLAKAILDILPKIQNSKFKIYNYSNEGVASWYDFAKEIMAIANIDCQVNSIETKDYPTPAKRPHYSLLNKKKIKQDFGLSIPYWKNSLQDCIYRILNDKF